MIALDTNILVYARRKETPHHPAALKLLRELAEGDTPWALPWPCVYEFLRVVTHRRVFDPPTPVAAALEDLDQLLTSPSLVLLGEGPAHARHFHAVLAQGRCEGNLVFDAHIAALCLEHGVREILTADEDMRRFPPLRARDPFQESSRAS